MKTATAGSDEIRSPGPGTARGDVPRNAERSGAGGAGGVGATFFGGADDSTPAALEGTSMSHIGGAVDDDTFETETSVSVDILSKEAGGPDGADQLYIAKLFFL